jgi:lactoylglutathione lyase
MPALACGAPRPHMIIGRMTEELESHMPKSGKARAIGFNHVALEVGDIDAALAFYGRLFDFELRGKSKTAAFIDLGDQFLAPFRPRGR